MASLLTVMGHVSRFGSDAAGLEKTLRLSQALAQIIIAYISSPLDAAPWLQARKQFALGRRYLRFFRFVDSFALAFKHFYSSTGITAVLDVGKWSCLGVYLLLESCTIMDGMEIWNTSWGPIALLEANKFWFYSLSFSLVLSFLQLFSISFAPPPPKTEKILRNGKKLQDSAEKVQLEAQEIRSKRQALMKKIVIDGCDLLIPGHITGWAKTTSAVVGMATVVSTTLSSGDVWTRLHKNRIG